MLQALAAAYPQGIRALGRLTDAALLEFDGVPTVSSLLGSTFIRAFTVGNPESVELCEGVDMAQM